MGFSKTLSFRAVLMSSATLTALTGTMTKTADAQQQPGALPPVTVDAPRPPAPRAAPMRRSTAARGPVRRTVAALPRAEPVRFTTPSTGTLGALPAPYAGGQVASGVNLGLLGNTNVFDAPVSVIGYTEQTIRDQQDRGVAEVLENNSSVIRGNPRAGNREELAIRGFFIEGLQFYFNGFPNMGNQRRNLVQGIERVELIKGPNALLTGVGSFASVAGTVNLVPKRATDDPITRLFANYSSNANFGSHIDVGRRYGENKEWGIRANLAANGGSTPVDYNKEKIGVGTLALDYRGERFRAAIDVSQQSMRLDASQLELQLAPNIAVPIAPRNTTNFNQNFAYGNSDQTIVTTRAEFDIAPEVTFGVGYGHRYFDERVLRAEARVTNFAGDFPVRLSKFNTDRTLDVADATLRAKFYTGPISHKISTAVSQFAEDDKSSGFGVAVIGNSNMYNPVQFPEPNIPLPPNRRNLTRDGRAFTIADTMGFFDDRVLLTVGGRAQRLQGRNFNTVTGLQTSSYDQSAFSPAAGLVVKPLQFLSLYANYMEGLEAGPVVLPPAPNAFTQSSPIQTQQKEVGAKFDFGRVGLTLAAFDITQPQQLTNPVTLFVDTSGRQRNKGVELEAFGEVMPGLRILGGATQLDARIENSADPLVIGKFARTVPFFKAVAGAEWDTPFIRGLTLTGRMINSTSNYWDAANTQRVPGWTRFDLGARYVTALNGKPVTIRAQVINVGDANYWEGLLYTTPRTFYLSTQFDF